MSLTSVAAWLKTKLTEVEAEIESVTPTAVVDELAALRTKYQPAVDAWLTKMKTISETQGLTILEQGLTDIGTLVISGGNPGTAIAALVPQVEAQVMADLKTDENTVRTDVRNAAYTAVGLAISALPAATVPVAPVAPAAA